jgi:hypothetical protein
MDMENKTSLGEVYKITHKETGKCYIGQTFCLSKTGRAHGAAERFKEHVRKARNSPISPLHQAISTFGADAFGVEVLARVPMSELDAKEDEYMLAFEATHPDKGFNVRSQGAGDRDARYESKRNAAKAQWQDPDFRAGASARAKKQWETDTSLRDKVAAGVKKASIERWKDPEISKRILLKTHDKVNANRGENLPMFVRQRFNNNEFAGYYVLLPSGKTKHFTSKSMTMEEKKQAAIACAAESRKQVPTTI